MTRSPTPDGFIETKEYRRFAEFCDACRRERYIGICHGLPGVGKTLSARHYARWDRLQPYTTRFFYEEYGHPVVDWNECHTILYTAPVASSPARIERAIQTQCGHLDCNAMGPKNAESWDCTWTELIIVDEADRLKMAGLEQMRDIYDRQGIGLVLVGMPGIEKRLSRYPQLYSRVGFVHRFRPLSATEVRFIITNKWKARGRDLNGDDFTDEETLASVIRITGGSFRLLDCVLAQIERVLQINEMRVVTKEVVEAARESLVVGVA